MKLFLYGIFFAWATLSYAEQKVTPSEGFARLMEGNKRYVEGKLTHPNRDQERRSQTVTTQKPFGIILGCSDSRVPPEILFDQGIGDLFVARVAGNVAGATEVASIEYAAIYLDSSIALVLGHKNCGAVEAVLEGKHKDIEPIADLIAPAVHEAHGQFGPELENAIKNNVKHTVNRLKAAPAIADLIKKKKFAVVGGYYDLRTGKVEILTEAPSQ